MGSSEGNAQLVEFTVSQLTSSGDQTPNIIIGNFSLDEPGQLEFDSNGNLWVANAGSATVAEFTPAQLATSGNPAAAVILSTTSADGAESLAAPWGMQFDGKHNLWVFDIQRALSQSSLPLS